MSDALWQRPVAWSATGDGEFPFAVVDGGIRYVLRVNDFPAEPLYTLIADGADVADLEDWPDVWTRPGMPDGLRAIAARELGRYAERTGRELVGLDVVVGWARTLCTTDSSDAATVLAALGIAGVLRERTAASALVEPAPLGTTRLAVGSYQGSFADLGIAFTASTVTCAELDARLGTGTPVPMVHAGNAWQRAYRIDVPGAPFAIILFAAFDSPPEPSSVAISVSLRREQPIS